MPRENHAEWCNTNHRPGETPCIRRVKEVRCSGCGATLNEIGSTEQLITAFIDIHTENCQP